MSEQLKPVRCGCGGEAYHDSTSCWNHEEEEWMPNFWHRVICKNCGTQTKAFYTEAEAIQVWNKAMGDQFREATKKIERTAKVIDKSVGRHSISDFDWTGKCEKCGNEIQYAYDYCPYCGARLDWSGNE